MTEDLLKQIQDWANSVPLIVLGSGASIPHGLPSMWRLGEHLKDSISFSNPDCQAQFETFKDKLNTLKDLEKTLLELNLQEDVWKRIVNETWKLINDHDLQAYESIIADDNRFPLVTLTKHLLNSSKRKVTIVTTNYDRIAEYAAGLSSAMICTGYCNNLIGQFSSSVYDNNYSRLNGYGGQVNIWKVHGSLDWFKTSSGLDIHLPLRHSIPDNCEASIVTPGLTKYYQTHIEPYRTILTQADREIEDANGYLCIGYGFNDMHVHPKLVSQIKKNKPIIVITKELTDGTKKTIIDGKCTNYILIEQANSSDTRMYLSTTPTPIVFSNVNYWSLEGFLNLIKS